MIPMLQRRTAANGVVYYASPLLEQIGVPHAFSTRIGGTSQPPFDSLNLGNPPGEIRDDYPRILSHYPLLLCAAGCPDGEWCRLHQVHGNIVHRVPTGKPFDKMTQGDALVSEDKTRAIAVRVADCVPVLFARADGKVVAAAHAGWRGVIAGVVLTTLREMRSDASKIVAAIGPSISLEYFEVGAEVIAEFDRAFGSDAPIRRRSDGKGFVDLRRCIQRQLTEAGMRADQIDGTDRCTFRDREEFYSHRRDHGVTGRMAAVISPA